MSQKKKKYDYSTSKQKAFNMWVKTSITDDFNHLKVYEMNVEKSSASVKFIVIMNKRVGVLDGQENYFCMDGRSI